MPDIIPSPQPPQPPDGHTPAYGLATNQYVKDKVDPLLARLRALAAAIGIVASAVVAVIIFIDNRVQAQTDAGVKVHEERITTLEQQRKDDKAEVNIRFDRVELNQNADHSLIIGVSQKMDALLRAQGVPNPAPTPKDGGGP